MDSNLISVWQGSYFIVGIVSRVRSKLEMFRFLFFIEFN